MKTSQLNTRLIAVQVMYQVVIKQLHLKQALLACQHPESSDHDRAWIQNVCYQSLRHHQNLSARWKKFIDKPLKDKLIAELLTLSLAQHQHLNTPDHAIVNEAIKTAKKLKKHWATGLINKVLKLALADKNFSPSNDTERFNHPQWWIDILKKDWPEHWQQIIESNNLKPPLWLRVKQQSSFAALMTQFNLTGKQHPTLKNAWLLNNTHIATHETLSQGYISVQDAAAQYAAHLLNPQAGEKILDACAAPGGKSCHLLELQPEIKLDILEKEPHRLELVEQNLNRLKLSAHRLIVGDATASNNWFEGEKYDKILLDVPCSAAGVVRRNPDIKLLRQPEHIKQLVELQQQILNEMALLVKTGGQILYATCSVFRSENERQMKKFLASNASFKTQDIQVDFSTACLHGQQIITGSENMDGFYYCLLEKTE